jgi:hypothetical protein
VTSAGTDSRSSSRTRLDQTLRVCVIASPHEPAPAGSHDRDDGNAAGGEAKCGRIEGRDADQWHAGGQVKTFGDAKSDAQPREGPGSGGNCDRSEILYSGVRAVEQMMDLRKECRRV